MERENSAFIDPVKDAAHDDSLWQRASNLWHHGNSFRNTYNNLAHH
jgi:hypothetical protein